MPITVAATMPLNTVVPIDRRLAAPAPVEISSGTVPRMKASAVISTARKRWRAPATAASTIDRPSARCSRANSTIRMAFFAARPTSSTSPICA